MDIGCCLWLGISLNPCSKLPIPIWHLRIRTVRHPCCTKAARIPEKASTVPLSKGTCWPSASPPAPPCSHSFVSPCRLLSPYPSILFKAPWGKLGAQLPLLALHWPFSYRLCLSSGLTRLHTASLESSPSSCCRYSPSGATRHRARVDPNRPLLVIGLGGRVVAGLTVPGSLVSS